MSIKFENTEVVGWEAALRGMRNPKNSWVKSDSKWSIDRPDGQKPLATHWNGMFEYGYFIGPNDMDLAMRLNNGGPVHAKYRRMIVVYVDITAPLYWWKEFDTYKVGTVANSCSTMHKIHEKEFTLDDFSHEHLETGYREDSVLTMSPNSDYKLISTDILELTIDHLNGAREMYLRTWDNKYWWQMIQLLPSSYNQKRTVMMSYEVLANIWKWRKNHKLDEWKEHNSRPDFGFSMNALTDGGVGFCDWIKTLPYSELITGEAENAESRNGDSEKGE